MDAPKLTRSKLLDMLRKHEFVKQDVARALDMDEKSIRRWCIKFDIDTDFERRKTIISREPLVVVPPQTIAGKSEKAKMPLDKSLERCFVFSDMQIPFHSESAFNIAAQRCSDYKPTHCIIIGDFQDYQPLLGKAKQRLPDLTTYELKELDLEFLTSAKILKQIESVLPKGCTKYFIKGNHEDRADQIIAKPDGDYWQKHVDIDERLQLTSRGWKVIRYNDKVKLGKLNYTHGAYFDTHHAQHHARTYCENVMYGHTHQVQVFTMPTPARELSFWSASIGCLANINPEWQRGKPNAWDHSFAEVDYLANGDFFPHIHRIINNRLMADGKLYKA
jgi:predicted phosphodiesterase